MISDLFISVCACFCQYIQITTSAGTGEEARVSYHMTSNSSFYHKTHNQRCPHRRLVFQSSFCASFQPVLSHVTFSKTYFEFKYQITAPVCARWQHRGVVYPIFQIWLLEPIFIGATRHGPLGKVQRAQSLVPAAQSGGRDAIRRYFLESLGRIKQFVKAWPSERLSN